MRPASTPRLPVTARVFVQRFSSTPRGARLARHLVVHRLDAWGVPYGSALSDTAALLVAELAANAVTHGRVPGRDIEVLLRLDAYTLRIDVSDSRGERRPMVTAVTAAPEAEHGRGCCSWTRWRTGGACSTAYPSARRSARNWICRLATKDPARPMTSRGNESLLHDPGP